MSELYGRLRRMKEEALRSGRASALLNYREYRAKALQFANARSAFRFKRKKKIEVIENE